MAQLQVKPTRMELTNLKRNARWQPGVISL